jgi:hypothetical protein
MNPRPPDLARATGDLSVEQVFWIEKNGLRMTGMPAFGKTDEDEELWKVAAFVKALPTFGAAEYASIPNAHEEEHEHGEGDCSAEKGAPAESASRCHLRLHSLFAHAFTRKDAAEK